MAGLRVSGPRSWDLVRKLAPFLPQELKSHQAYVGFIKNLEQNENLDQVIVLPFLEGHSFTGEESAEIFCHGSPILVDRIMTELIAAGASVAEKGEFTLRSFLNGKVDLVQAESVLELIHSESDFSARQALNQLRGKLSRKIERLESDLIWCLAHIEAGIDFSEADIAVAEEAVLKAKLKSIEDQIQEVADSFAGGRVVKEGLRIVISGQPNVGKSSLLNALAEEEKAIVSSRPGTTRDPVEVRCLVGGISAAVVDTAGLRETSDEIEAQGIAKSQKARASADINVFVVDAALLLGGPDGSLRLNSEDLELLAQSQNAPVLLVLNKIDLRPDLALLSEAQVLEKVKKNMSISEDRLIRVLCISALDTTSGTKFRGALEKFLQRFDLQGDGVLTNSRHHEQIMGALLSLREALKMLAGNQGLEFVSIELKQSLMALQNLLGKRFDDDVLDRVFKEFCLGK